MTAKAEPGAGQDVAQDAAAIAAALRRGNLRGIGFMLLTGLLFVGVTVIVRHLGTDMPAPQSAFIRYAFGTLMLAHVFWRLRADLRKPPRIWALYGARGILHAVGVSLWFYAMARIPIAEVTALGFTAPIFTTLGAALFLGEALTVHRVGAVLMGFGGAMVILQPGLQEVSLGQLAQLAAAPLFACSFLMAKRLTRVESSASIVALLSLFVTVALLPAALPVWRAPTLEELGWLLVVAALATAGHMTLTQAFRSADMAVTQPIQFFQLVWAALLGLALFGEQPELWTWVGGGMIVASATWIARHESRARPAAPRAPPTKQGE
jgi:drug/metabolite transporter (DMT)-like permease